MTFKVIDKKTGKEADTYKIALKEDWAKHLIYCDIEGFAIEEDGSLVLLDECGNVAYCPDDRFEIVFEEEEPQGEWVEGANGSIKCNQCGCEIIYSYFVGNKPELPKFCCDCGKKMKGGAE